MLHVALLFRAQVTTYSYGRPSDLSQSRDGEVAYVSGHGTVDKERHKTGSATIDQGQPATAILSNPHSRDSLPGLLRTELKDKASNLRIEARRTGHFAQRLHFQLQEFATLECIGAEPVGRQIRMMFRMRVG